MWPARSQERTSCSATAGSNSKKASTTPHQQRNHHPPRVDPQSRQRPPDHHTISLTSPPPSSKERNKDANLLQSYPRGRRKKRFAANNQKDLTKLPAQYKDFESLFHEENAASLPPHRNGHDLEVRLEEGTELPHGPLYAMTKEELVVSTEGAQLATRKNASSPQALRVHQRPVLFVKKTRRRTPILHRLPTAQQTSSKKDRYPLPLWKETLQKLGNAQWFTKLDVTAAFHRIRVRAGDEWLTAFKTRFGLFQWNVAPFGFVNSPAAFQRFVNTVLQDYLDDFVTAYVDDFLIFSSNGLDDHRAKVKKVLERLV